MILYGKPVADKIAEDCAPAVSSLIKSGTMPCLAILRVGAREDDLAYERGIKKRFESAGASVTVHELNDDVTQAELEKELTELNNDSTVHGILVFRPLPKHLSEEPLKSLIAAEKDVDCMGLTAMARLYSGTEDAVPPCTPAAVMKILSYYGIPLSGKRVAVVGRSLVIGKPLAMLMLSENATVTICHTRTADLKRECKNADIIAVCAGKAHMLTAEYVNPGQTVIDVGINELDGSITGDVLYSEVEPIVENITPVPRGVGAVTSAVILSNTVSCAVKLDAAVSLMVK